MFLHLLLKITFPPNRRSLALSLFAQVTSSMRFDYLRISLILVDCFRFVHATFWAIIGGLAQFLSDISGMYGCELAFFIPHGILLGAYPMIAPPHSVSAL